MAAPRYGPPASPSGERWNVNMPAVIGVIFVFLLGVIVWVIATGGSDEGAGDAGDASSEGSATAPSITQAQDAAATGTTTPAPMPSTTATPETTATSTTTTLVTELTEAPEVTAATGAEPDAVPGDLAIAGRPMQRPPCEDAYITILASAVGDQATATGIANVLETYPGSNYLRTDQTCTSLNPDIDGEPIYVVFLGPFAFDSDACTARAEGPEGAYARVLSNDVGPDHGVPCG